jgi:hypothetical protein
MYSEHMNTRGAEAGNNQIAPFHVRMWSIRAQGRTARIPSETFARHLVHEVLLIGGDEQLLQSVAVIERS